jgi:hypothetical protein
VRWLVIILSSCSHEQPQEYGTVYNIKYFPLLVHEMSHLLILHYSFCESCFPWPHCNTRLIHEVRFPGAMYRNKTQLHGNIYCNRYSKCSAFFQHIRHRNWDICHTVGPISVYCVVEVCRLGLEPLCSGVSFFGTHRAHNFLNNRCSVPISCNKEREIYGKWLLSSVIVKLCSVHSETLSLTALHSRRELE